MMRKRTLHHLFGELQCELLWMSKKPLGSGRTTLFNILSSPCRDQVNIILTPDGLAGSMCINSVYSSHKIPKFSLAADIPRVAIHFVNHRTYAGKSELLRIILFNCIS